MIQHIHIWCFFHKFYNLKLILKILTASILINFAIIYFFKSYSLISNFIIISALFLIIFSLIDFYQLFKKKNIDSSRVISHLAFGFLVLSIGLNYNFSLEKDFNLKLGEREKFADYSIKFNNLQLVDFKNYKAVIGEFKINNSQKNPRKTLMS